MKPVETVERQVEVEGWPVRLASREEAAAQVRTYARRLFTETARHKF